MTDTPQSQDLLRAARSAKERSRAQTAEALRGRLKQRQREAAREVEQWAQESASLAAEVQTNAQQAVFRQPKRALARRGKKLARRRLRLLERNDALVQQVLERRGKLSAIMGAEQATDADEMIWFLVEELKLASPLEQLAPPRTRLDDKTGKVISRREGYAPLVLNLIGLLSRYLGLESKPEIDAVVLTDLRWMSLLGFNAQEVQEGVSHRSESLRGKTREGRGGRFTEADALGPVRTRLEGARGALSSQTLEAHESALEPAALMRMFNAVVQALAGQGFFPKQLRASLDSTGAEVAPSFSEAGGVKKKVKVQSKARRPRQLEVSVRGFKVWLLMEVETGLPLAMTVDTIETAETLPAKALIDQARDNLGEHARLVSVALDRGFLDGDLLEWLKTERGIDWVCPSKEKMHVTAEARQRVNAALAALSQGQESALQTAQRAARRGLSPDGVSFFEREVGKHREPLVLAEVPELLLTEFYGTGGSGSSRVNSKSYRPTPLYATVFSTLALTLHRGLQLHREQMAQVAERRAETLGVLRYRRQQRIKNRDQVIVVVQEHFGIFSLHAFALFLGVEFNGSASFAASP